MATNKNPNRDHVENADLVWEACINDRLFTFRKSRRKGGAFLYTCATKSGGKTSITSFFSEKNMTPKELETLPRFITFVSAAM
jgi:hypothetical protein